MIDVFRTLLCIHNTINIEIVKLGKNQHDIIHKSIKQSSVSSRYNKRERRLFCY